MNADELALRMESGLPVAEGISTSAWCPTGERFVVFKAFGATENEASAELLKSFEEYASGKSGTLYWRMRPQAVIDDGRYVVRTRLVIG